MVGEDEYLPLWKGRKSEKSLTAYEFAQNCMGTPTKAAGNFSVLLVCLTTPTTHASSITPYLSAVTQLRVFLVSSYNWLYPHPVMVQGVRSRKPLLLFRLFLLPYSPSRVGCQEHEEAGSE